MLTTEFTLHAIRDANARRAWAAQQRRVRDELVTVVDEAVARQGLTLPIPTELFVLAAISLAQGSMTQRLVETRARSRSASSSGPSCRSCSGSTPDAADRQPPDTALMMWTRAPAGTAAPTPSPRVASSPLTKTLTWRRI